MAELRLLGRQIGDEQRAFWRNRGAAFFTVAFPVTLLLIFATMNARTEVPSLHVRYVQYYVPSMVAFGIMGACYTNLATGLCLRRQSGYLKRLRGTPLRPAHFFAGLIASTVLVALLLTATIVITGVVGYHVTPPRHWPLLCLTLLLGAAAFCALAIATTVLIPDAESAPAILNGVFYSVVFISGAFYPVPAGSVLAHLASVFPIRHFIDATYACFAAGRPVVLPHLLVLIGWALTAVPLALRRFRWQPAAH